MRLIMTLLAIAALPAATFVALDLCIPKAAAATSDADALYRQHCLACHGVESKIVGPALRDIAARHAKEVDLEGYLAGKIKSGGQGVWGAIPMPPQTLADADARIIAKWLAAGAPK